MEGENPLPDLPLAHSRVLPFPRPQIWLEEDFYIHPFWEWASWCNQEYPQLIQKSQSVAIVGNINFLISHGTPGLSLVASPIKIPLGGCSPMGILSLAIG